MDRRLGLRWTESIHLPFGLVHVHRVHVCVAGEGNSSASFPGVLPPVVSSPASSHSGASAQLRWEKASPGLGEYGGGVKVATRALAMVVGGLAWRCSPVGHLGAVLGVLVPCFLSDS